MDAKHQRKMTTMNPMSRKGKWTNEEEVVTARIIHYFGLGVLQLPEGTTLRAYLAQKLDCDPMRITKKFTGTNCLGKRVYHSCERTTATYEVAKHAVEELAELERRFRARLERNKEKRTGILDIEAHLLGSRNLGANPPMDARGMSANASQAGSGMHSFAPPPATGQAAAMSPSAGVAAAAAAAGAAWNPLSQVYSLPPGYPAPPPPQNGVFARPPVPAMPAIHAFGMPHVGRPPSSGHPHQLTTAVLHSHQLQQAAAYSNSQQFSPGASAGSGAPAKGAGSSSGHGMLSCQSVTGSEKSAGGSKRQQMPPPLPPAQQQQGSQAPTSAGIPPQAYLQTASGQMHNPYWPYHAQHMPGDLHSQGAYADFGAGASAPGAMGFAHLGMAYPLQHQQWLHQQQGHAAVSGGGGGVIGMSLWQRQHHQVPHPQHLLLSTRGGELASAGLSPASTSEHQGAGAAAVAAVASSLSSHFQSAFSSGNLSSASQTTTSCCSAVEGRPCSTSPTSSEACGGDAGTALPLRARRRLSSDGQGAPSGGASSADAAAVVSAERDTVSSTMASPLELQQMYKPGSSRGKSGRRRHHRSAGGAGEEESIASSIPRSKPALSNSSQGSTTADNSSSLGSLSGGSSGSGSRTGSGSDEQQNKSDRKGKGGAGGGGSSGSTSGSESGSEEAEKQASNETTDDSQTGAPPSSRMDVDGAGGLLMGFIESLTKQHKLDQQQQQQQQQDHHHRHHAPARQSQPEDKQRATLSPPSQQQQRPTPPSPHAFPRVRHKHAARMELEVRLASGAGGSKGSCAGTASGGGSSSNSSPAAKKLRHAIETYAASPSGRQSSGCGSSSGSSGGRGVRDAVSPPLRLSQMGSSAAVAGAMCSPWVESRKRPREQQQQGLIGGGGLHVPAPVRSPPGIDMEEEAGEASSAGDGRVSSEGSFEEDGDVGSWGSSGKEMAGSTEDSNEASVSEGDYVAGDERSSSFEERDNTDGFEGGGVPAPRRLTTTISRSSPIVADRAGPRKHRVARDPCWRCHDTTRD